MHIKFSMYIHSTCLFFTCYVYKCISIIAVATSTPSPTGTACIQCMGQIVSSRVYSFCLNEKALKCKPSALIFGHGRAKELLHVRDDLRSGTRNGKYTEEYKNSKSPVRLRLVAHFQP